MTASDDGATTDPDIEVGEADDASDDEQTSDNEEAPDDPPDEDGGGTEASGDGADPTDGDAVGELVATDVAEPGTWPVGRLEVQIDYQVVGPLPR